MCTTSSGNRLQTVTSAHERGVWKMTQMQMVKALRDSLQHWNYLEHMWVIVKRNSASSCSTWARNKTPMAAATAPTCARNTSFLMATTAATSTQNKPLKCSQASRVSGSRVNKPKKTHTTEDTTKDKWTANSNTGRKTSCPESGSTKKTCLFTNQKATKSLTSMATTLTKSLWK